jgi:hypothetical protein
MEKIMKITESGRWKVSYGCSRGGREEGEEMVWDGEEAY